MCHDVGCGQGERILAAFRLWLTSHAPGIDVPESHSDDEYGSRSLYRSGVPKGGVFCARGTCRVACASRRARHGARAWGAGALKPESVVWGRPDGDVGPAGERIGPALWIDGASSGVHVWGSACIGP